LVSIVKVRAATIIERVLKPSQAEGLHASTTSSPAYDVIGVAVRPLHSAVALEMALDATPLPLIAHLHATAHRIRRDRCPFSTG
jgi:hypothetical protein